MTRCRVMIMIFSFLFSWNITNVSYDHFVVNFVHTVTLFLFHMSIDIFLVRRNVSSSWCPPVAMGIYFSVQISLFCYVLTIFFGLNFLRYHHFLSVLIPFSLWPRSCNLAHTNKKQKQKQNKNPKAVFGRRRMLYVIMLCVIIL